MSWLDRLRQLAYTAPDGTRTELTYGDVKSKTPLKTTEYEYADSDFTVVQQFGHGGRRIPLQLFFSGTDYDQEADAFEALLLQRGSGILEHPVYGTRSVVPSGDVAVSDALVSGANQRTISVVFIEIGDIELSTGADDDGTAALASVSSFEDAVAADFDPASRQQYVSLLDQVDDKLQAAADTLDSARRRFNEVNTSINSALTTLIGAPLTLAFQTIELINAPSRAAMLIQDRLAAYRNLLDSITGETRDLRTAELFAMTSVSASVVASVSEPFATRAAALSSAESLLSSLDAVTLWRQTLFDATGDTDQLDTGASYQALQEAVSLASASLITASFTLASQRTIVLSRRRTLIDLAGELFGQVDSRLDELISENALTGDEILELPAGKSITYLDR